MTPFKFTLCFCVGPEKPGRFVQLKVMFFADTHEAASSSMHRFLGRLAYTNHEN